MQAKVISFVTAVDGTEYAGIEWIGVSEWARFQEKKGKFANVQIGDIVEFTKEEYEKLNLDE